MNAAIARYDSDNKSLSHIFERIRLAAHEGTYDIQASSFEVNELLQSRLRDLDYKISAIDHDQIRISW